jgi:hypothetical protein
MQKRADRPSARGGRALLTGWVRCGRCGRRMRVFYGSRAGHAHRCQGKGNGDTGGGKMCLGAGGVRLDRAVAEQLLQAVSGHAIEAATQAEERAHVRDDDVRLALNKELESARQAARRYQLVDSAKRLVARELEGRWNTALERVAEREDRLKDLGAQAEQRPFIDRSALLALAHDLPTAWNAGDTRTQRPDPLARRTPKRGARREDACPAKSGAELHFCAKAKEFRFHLHVVSDHSLGEHTHPSGRVEWQVRLAASTSKGDHFRSGC